jgi:hypothetical protein
VKKIKIVDGVNLRIENCVLYSNNYIFIYIYKIKGKYYGRKNTINICKNID